MAKPEDLPAISEETIEELEKQVKKGKARKFFLIYKGASIKTLGVFKKGPFGPKIMKAKKDGFKGDVAYGVVTGSGKNLFFSIPANMAVAEAMKVDSSSDGPPTKVAKLREFLSDAGLSFKPSYHMIESVGEAIDPEAESDIPVAPPLPNTATEDDEPTPVPEAPPVPTDAALTFTQLLKKLKPDLGTVVAADTSVSQQVKVEAGEAGALAKNRDYDQALVKLRQVESLLQVGLSELRDAKPSGNNAAEFKARLQNLMPAIKAAAGSSPGDEAKLRASEAGMMARKNDFAQANLLLDAVEKALAGPASSQPASTGNESSQFATRLKELLPRIKAAAGTGPGDEAKLRASEAAVFARKSEFSEANRLLDLSEQALAKQDAATETPANQGASTEASSTQGDALTIWKSARAEAVNQLKVVAKDLADERHADSAGAIIELKAVIANLTAEPKTEQQIDELERYLTQDDVVLDVCELAHDIRPSLLDALAALRPQLLA